MLIGLIMGLVIFCLVWTAGNLFEEALEDWLMKAIPLAGISGLIFAIASKIPAVVAVITSVVVLLMMCHIAKWWADEGSSFKELLTFILLDLLLTFVAGSGAARILDITHIRWIVKLVRVLPWVAFGLSALFFMLDMILWKESIRKRTDDDCEEVE